MSIPPHPRSAARSPVDAERVLDLARAVGDNVASAVVGRAEALELLLVALLSRGHVLIEDVPGTGKTTLAKAFAASLRCGFRRLQCTPDLMPADVLGVNVYLPERGQFEFRPGPVFTQVLLADEINRATPRTQSALLEAMQEGQVSVDGVTSALPTPFMVIATLNPVELEGTFPLPEAQLDRFALRITMGYPSQAEENDMLARFAGPPHAQALEPVVGPEDIDDARATVDAVVVDAKIRAYVLAIARATRAEEHVHLGASPRAALVLQRAAQARAALHGRGYVLPDDVKALAGPVLAHRLVVDSSARLRGSDGSSIVADLLASVPVPLTG
ncbi:MAG: AAA family ATPase [Gammaproteobacteria bacterium]|nr:AAA family ATPase [Gammaproteobacteria bacterium]